MRLKKVKISNFRSFDEKEEVINFNDLTTFIGNNSTGKTASIQALLKLFGEGNKSLVRSDFHISPDNNPEEIEQCELYIEAVFDFPDLDEENDVTDNSIPLFFDNFVVEEEGASPYLRIRLESTWTKGNTPDGSVDTNIYFITLPEEAEIREKDRKRASNAVLSNIRCLYVPATRNPNEQLKIVSGSILYRILKRINWSNQTTDNINHKVEELNSILFTEKGIDMIRTSINNSWKNYHSESRYNEAQLTFEDSDINMLLKNIGVKFSPTEIGRDYNVNELGDGLRSLFYISLVNSLLEIENKIILDVKQQSPFTFNPPVLTILAVEEPENHIAPHLLGKVVKNLTGISHKNNAQTVLTSHSSSIVKRIDSIDLRYFRLCKETLSTIVGEIHLPKKESDSYKFVKGAVEAYPELYFAKLVVLGEGDSEEYVVKKILDDHDYHIDSEGISIVPLGGRHVNHFWKLLNELDIPHVTLLDFDRERKGGGWGRIKYVIEQLIENGVTREAILSHENGLQMTEKEFSNMINWTCYDEESVNPIIELLENYDVFFSYPLDLDFTLLEAYPEQYKESLEDAEGPQIKINNENIKVKNLGDIQFESPEYKNRIDSDVRQTLKKSGGDGSTYSFEQKELMIWYNYFFLSKSKPITHMRAFENNDIKEDDLPGSFQRFINRIVTITRNEK